MIKRIVALLAALAGFIFIFAGGGTANAATYTTYRAAMPVIYVEDHANGHWAVKASTAVWDAETDARVSYGKCRAGATCVRVYEGNYGHTVWSATTMLTYTWGGSHWYVSYARIYFNDYFKLSLHEMRQASCHEEGHAIGLEYHSPSLTSCMYASPSNRASIYPNVGDRANVNRVY